MRVLLVFLMLVVGSSGCGGGGSDAALNVYAASSLRDLLEVAAVDFERATGTPLRVSTGGSGLVAEQLLAGAPADVFLSAGRLEVERLEDAGLVRSEDVRSLFSNQLVVIAPRGARLEFEVRDLAAAARVSMAHPEAVPAGRYARAWLGSIGLWEAVEPHVVRGSNVRAALAAVASGGAAFGIVYASDVVHFDSVEVVYRVPLGEGPRIEYPGAVLAAAAHPALAKRFLDELADPAGPWAETAAALGFQLEP